MTEYLRARGQNDVVPNYGVFARRPEGQPTLAERHLVQDRTVRAHNGTDTDNDAVGMPHDEPRSDGCAVCEVCTGQGQIDVSHERGE